jgi:integrase
VATIRKRKRQDGKNSYQAIIRLQGHPPASASFPNKTAAKSWAQRTELEIRENRYFKQSEASKHSMSELIDRYIKQVLPDKRDAKNQERQLHVWKDKIGDKLIADITPAVVVQVRDELKAERASGSGQRSGATVNRFLAVLSHLFSVAVRDWQWADQNPVKGVSRLKEPAGRVRYLSDAEREALLASSSDLSPTLLLIVVLALSTGARRGEIMSLRWKDVDLSGGRAILQQTKNNERRVIPIAGYALELFKQHSKVRQFDSELVFPDPRDSSKSWSFEATWRKAREAANLEDFRFHDLRHSAASYLAMNGATTAEIAEVLGHKTLQMVKRYAHLSDQHISDVVGRMNGKIFG